MATTNVNELTPEERMLLETERNILINDLDSSRDVLGDWRVVKFLETMITSDKFWELFESLELPYTREQITAYANARIAKRVRINEIEELLKEEEQENNVSQIE